MQSLNHSRICEETKTRGRRDVSIPTRKDLETINAEWGEDGEMGTRLARERVGTYPLLGALLRARACTRHRVHFRIAPLRSTEKHSAPAPSVCARGGSHSKPLRATDLTRDWAAAVSGFVPPCQVLSGCNLSSGQKLWPRSRTRSIASERSRTPLTRYRSSERLEST